MDFKNSIDFFNYCEKLYLKIMKKQYPDMEQGSAMYSLCLKSLDYLSPGSYFLIPNTNEYYSLTDSDIVMWNRNDRLLFIDDMNKSEDIFKFILLNSRHFYKDKSWRRVSAWKHFNL